MESAIVSHTSEIRGHPVRDVTILGERFREWNGYVFHLVGYYGSKTGEIARAFEIAFDAGTQEIVRAAMEIAECR